MLERENPRTVTKLKVDDETRFEYLFLSFGPCINDFVSCCRSVIMIDGIHLKEKFRNVMFVTTTKDGNKQIYPIAFGFGDGENHQSWSSF